MIKLLNYNLKLITRFRLTLIFLFISGIVYGQSFEEYVRQEAGNLKNFSDQQGLWISNMRKDFLDFVAQRDKDFAEFLKQDWKSYEIKSKEKFTEKQKPRTAPEFNENDSGKQSQIKDNGQLLLKTIVPIIENGDKPLPSLSIQKYSSPVKKSTTANFNFYGLSVLINYDPEFLFNIPDLSGKAAIASYWDKANKTNYPLIINQLLSKKEEMNLNDYCYFLLIKKFAGVLYGNNEMGQTLATWFLMLRSGYGLRLATNDSQLVLLLPTRNTLYGKSFLKEGSTNYYIMGQVNVNQLKTYDEDYFGANRLIDFNFSSPINLGHKVLVKNFKFDYNLQSYQINVSFDENLMNLYNDYPNVDMSVYFNAAVSLQTKQSLAVSLLPMISGLSEEDAVNFLLGFVQHAFAYKTDLEQFGHEKFFFAEELFFYPFSDCEDRAVLFSYLVRELLGLNTIGLEYPEHVATAVKFPSPVKGDYITFGQDRYMISDPTYINASVGMTIPQCRNSSPKVIQIENIRGLDIKEKSIWDLAQKNGCFPGSNLNNIKELKDGSFLLTGYYDGGASLGGKALPSTSRNRVCFIGQIAVNGTLSWVEALPCSGNSVGISVNTDTLGNIYVAGSFSGEMSSEGKTIKTTLNKPDGFISCWSPAGSLKWINKLYLDTIPNEAPVAFSASFDTKGKYISLLKTDNYDDFSNWGLFTNGSDKIVYNGILNRVFSAVPFKIDRQYATEAIAGSPAMLKKETDALIADKTDKSIAGLFAAIQLVKNSGVTLSGKDAQTALDQYNPAFKNFSPNIYKNLAKVNFVQNSDGIISIMTENGNDILFDKIKIKNKSKFNISASQNGDLQFDILSGMRVGKMVVWYNLNSIHLYKANGDILFDYDADHSQQKVNLRKDILK